MITANQIRYVNIVKYYNSELAPEALKIYAALNKEKAIFQH